MSSAKTLVISFVGMKPLEIGVRPTLNVVMKSDAEVLDEVVVTGYIPVLELNRTIG